jgi:hypothetical protein
MKHITQFKLAEEVLKRTLNSSTYHFKNRLLALTNQDSHLGLCILEPNTNHCYKIFFNWQDFKEWLFDEVFMLADYDVCYNDEYRANFGYWPIPMMPSEGMNKIIHLYDEKTGYYHSSHQDTDGIYNAICDRWRKVAQYQEKLVLRRCTQDGYIISSYKTERINKAIFDANYVNAEQLQKHFKK